MLFMERWVNIVIVMIGLPMGWALAALAPLLEAAVRWLIHICGLVELARMWVGKLIKNINHKTGQKRQQPQNGK